MKVSDQYGCNPTGMTTSAERRLEVLELARKYNFLILEGKNIPEPYPHRHSIMATLSFRRPILLPLLRQN